MSALDRRVGGVTCREVLADLSAFVDGELAEDRVAVVRAHLAGCDNCERFGGEFAAVVRGLRALLAQAPPLAPAVAARLRERLG